MLRHIVMWKLAAEDVAEKARDSSLIASSLEALVSDIPEIASLSVSTDSTGIQGNWDVCLVGDFADEQALRAYIDHPEHQRAAAIVRALVSQKAAVDILV